MTSTRDYKVGQRIRFNDRGTIRVGTIHTVRRDWVVTHDNGSGFTLPVFPDDVIAVVN